MPPPRRPSTHAAVAHDGHTNSIYWTIEGGQGNVYLNSGGSPDTAEVLYEIRDQPFSIEYDWLSNRLFWVEDGIRVSYRGLRLLGPDSRSGSEVGVDYRWM